MLLSKALMNVWEIIISDAEVIYPGYSNSLSRL